MHMVKSLRGNLFGENEWETFSGLHDTGDPTGGSVPTWVAETNRTSVKRLRGNLPKVWEALHLDDESMWKEFAAGSDDLPVQVSKTVTAFQKVLTYQAVCPERLASAMEAFASGSLKVKDINPPALRLVRKKWNYHENKVIK